MPAGCTPQNDRTYFNAERVCSVAAAHMRASRPNGPLRPPHRTNCWRFEKRLSTAPRFEAEPCRWGGRALDKARTAPGRASPTGRELTPAREPSYGVRAGRDCGSEMLRSGTARVPEG